MSRLPDPPRDEEEYTLARLRAMANFCPPTYPCKTCKWPVIDGYICPTCGEVDPEPYPGFEPEYEGDEFD